MKNLNSITGVKNAVAYEIRRQVRAYQNNETIIQETRRWDAELGRTTSMRSKEESHDYRYFPDPDLMPVRLPREKIEALRAELPERVFDQQRRYQETLGLPYTITSVICFDYELARYFELAMATYDGNPKALANYVANELQRERSAALGDGSLPMIEVKLSPENLAGLVKVIDEGVISKHIAKDVFVEMFQTGKAATAIIEEKGLQDDTDSSELEGLCREVVAANGKAAAEFREGNDKAINSFIGPIMKATRGKANPKLVQQTLRKVLSE